VITSPLGRSQYNSFSKNNSFRNADEQFATVYRRLPIFEQRYLRPWATKLHDAAEAVTHGFAVDLQVLAHGPGQDGEGDIVQSAATGRPRQEKVIRLYFGLGCQRRRAGLVMTNSDASIENR
jgi:hypothetical protein